MIECLTNIYLFSIFFLTLSSCFLLKCYYFFSNSEFNNMLSIELPDKYGVVLFTAGFLPSLTNFLLSGKVMKARKQYDVKYPNLYATPGYHKDADNFNRVQRGHQHIFESLSDFRINSLIGGLHYPIVVSVFGVIYSLGSYLYLVGYADTSMDVKTARLKKGGPLSFLANIVIMGCSAATTYSLCKQA